MTTNRTPDSRLCTATQGASVALVFISLSIHIIGRIDHSPLLWYSGLALFTAGLLAVGLSFRVPSLTGIAVTVIVMFSAVLMLIALEETAAPGLLTVIH